ncbi:MAG TPA: hypothetical protein VGQ71_02600 [Terriglobales bacterium]|nr:hypothetical protein [Terriglobales bacterium]
MAHIASASVFALLVSSFIAAAQTSGSPQQPAQRDPQAAAVIARSVSAMGNAAFSDSAMSGQVQITAGGASQDGTIRVLTRGLDQSLEEWTVGGESDAVVYSRGFAMRKAGGSSQSLSGELAVTTHSKLLPVVWLSALIADSDISLFSAGQEQQGNSLAYHLRAWRSFAYKPELRHLSEFSVADLWIDATSFLPTKIAYQQRAARGIDEGIRIELTPSDYKALGGIVCPLTIEVSRNGTPWAHISITTVSLNTGLTDAEFAIQVSGGGR